MWNFPWRPPAQNNIFHKIHFPKHSGKILWYSMCCFWRNHRIIESSHLSYCQKLQANESSNLLIRLQNYSRAQHLLADMTWNQLLARQFAGCLFAERRLLKRSSRHFNDILLIIQGITCRCKFWLVWKWLPWLLQVPVLLMSNISKTLTSSILFPSPGTGHKASAQRCRSFLSAVQTDNEIVHHRDKSLFRLWGLWGLA